jgi:nucleotide-binding universal stress UspA family protein
MKRVLIDLNDCRRDHADSFPPHAHVPQCMCVVQDPCDGPAGSRFCLIEQSAARAEMRLAGTTTLEGKAMTKANIIIATDLSARSDRHVERGLALASDLDCQPVIAHIVASGLKADENESSSVLRRLRRDFGSCADSWKVSLGEGKVPEALAEAAIVHDACLIVVGIARFNNLRDFVLGTAVDHLVRHAAVPVLVVKQGAHHPYGRLAVATDFSECSAYALTTALALFPKDPMSRVDSG